MPTTRYSELFGIPERTYRRWQARARAGQPGKGPWPRPARSSHRVVVVALATQHPAWGHRKIWAMARHAGHPVTASTVLRILDDEGLLLKAHYQRERRRLAQQRRAAFAEPPTGPNQVWQLDFSEYETTTGGTWRVGGIADYWSKYEYGWHWSPTANQFDAIAAVELAVAERPDTSPRLSRPRAPARPARIAPRRAAALLCTRCWVVLDKSWAMVSLARDRRLYPDRRSAFALDVMLRWVADHAFRSGVTRLAMAALVICAAAVSSRWALAVLTGLPALFGSAVNVVGAYQEERNVEPRNPLVRWSVLNAVQGAGRLVPNLGGVLEGAGAIGLLLIPSFIAVDTAGWLRVTAQIAAVVYTSSVLASVLVDPAWYNPNERPPAVVDWLRMASGPIISLATWWVTVLAAQWTTEQATLLTLATAIPALVVLRITETDRLLAYAAAQAQTSELDGRDLVLAQAHALMSAPVRVAWALAHESRERDRELYDHIRMMRTRFFQLGHLEELEHSDLTLPDSLVRPVLRLARAFGTHPVTRVLISEISPDDHDLARIVIDDLVTNAGQADARMVTVTVERLATHLVITVEDDADLIRGDVWKAPGSSLARLDRILTRRGGDLVLNQSAGSPKEVVARWVADDTTF